MNGSPLTVFKSKLRGVLAVMLCLLTTGTLRAEAVSIQDFVAEEAKWNNLVGTSWTLEGRYSVISDRQMQFINCPLKFLLPTDTPRNRSGSTVVEVTGQIVRSNGEIAFQVTSLRGRPNDQELLRLKRGEIDSQDPDQWYRVAGWARKRGEFYKDASLLKEAVDLDSNGVQTEFRKIGTRDSDALANLVQKARSLKVEPRLIQQIVHEGILARLQEVRARAFSDDMYGALLIAIRKDLPGSEVPLDPFPEKLAERYREQRSGTYGSVEEARRPQLHRILLLDVTTERILQRARPDGSNGFDIAAQLQAEAPEQKELIRQMEDRGIEAQLKKVDVMSRAQMLEVSQRVEKMGRNETSADIKRKWLIAREPVLRAEGARGLSDLAEQWLALLNDREAAAQFYIEATKLNPQYEPAVNWLRENGYQLVQGGWYPAGKVPVTPPTATERAIQEGRVVKGMTDVEVKAAMGDVPTSVTRIASLGQVMEIWIYERQGIMIRLERATRNEPSRVVNFESVTAPRE